MEAVTVATVLLVWCLAVLVVLIAYLSGAHRGDALAAQVSRAARRAADLETWARMGAPTRIIRTPSEALAWRRERESIAPTVQSRAPYAAPSADTPHAWAQQTMGLRVPTEIAATAVDARPAELEAALHTGASTVSECEYSAQEGTGTVRINGEVLEYPEALVRTVYRDQVNAPRIRDWPQGFRVPVGLCMDYLNWNPKQVASA